MKNLFIPYELAVLAKEKEFNEPCFGYYKPIKDWMFKGTKLNPEPHFIGPNWVNKDNTFYFMYKPNSFGDRDCVVKNSDFTKAVKNISVPTYQQIVDWFREEHKIVIWIEHYSKDTRFYFQCPQVTDKDVSQRINHWGDTYYEALNKAIEEAFKLI